MSGGGRAGKPRCWRGQGLRRSALCGWAGEGTTGGQFVSRGDAGAPGSAQALVVTGLGLSPRPGTPAHRPSPGWPDWRRPGSGVRRPCATRRRRSVKQFPPGARRSVCPRPPSAQHPVNPEAACAALLARRPQASGLRAARVPALSRPHSGHLARDGCAPSQRFPKPGTFKARLFDIAPLDSLSMSVLWPRT